MGQVTKGTDFSMSPVHKEQQIIWEKVIKTVCIASGIEFYWTTWQKINIDIFEQLYYIKHRKNTRSKADASDKM